MAPKEAGTTWIVKFTALRYTGCVKVFPTRLPTWMVLFIALPSLALAREEASDFLPPPVRRVLERNPLRGGPNCFGVTLAAHGLAQGVTHVTGAEFKLLLESPALGCKSVQAGEPLKTGDIGVIRTSDTVAVPSGIGHAFTWYSDQQVLSKASADPDDATFVEPLVSQYDRFFIPEECRKFPLPAERGAQCPVRIEAWRCEGWAENWKTLWSRAPLGWSLLRSQVGLQEAALEAWFYDRSESLPEPKLPVATWTDQIHDLHRDSPEPLLEQLLRLRIEGWRKVLE